MEALASATPLVTTDAGGIGSVAIDHQTALVVPQADAASLARAIDELLGQPDRARWIGETARATAIARWTWEQVAARFERAYARAKQAAGRKSQVDG
jgi:glycosyltransferase involved in cell wall biosynthesis